MALLIKKFGGTSVGDITKIKEIAQNIVQSKEAGNDIVVGVSAMGNSTDHLNKLAESISNNPNSRELDMLLSTCLLYTSPSPRDRQKSRMPSSA